MLDKLRLFLRAYLETVFPVSPEQQMADARDDYGHRMNMAHEASAGIAVAIKRRNLPAYLAHAADLIEADAAARLAKARIEELHAEARSKAQALIMLASR